MTTTASAPAPGSTPGPGHPPAPSRRPNITLRRVLLTVGAVLIILALAWQGIRLVTLSGYEDHSGSHPITESVTAVDIRSTSTELDVVAGDVSAPVLEFDQGRSDMVLRHDVSGGELSVVVEPRLRGVFGVTTGSASLRVLLPAGGDGLDLQVRSTAGQVLIDGDYGEVNLDTTATDSTLTGSANDLTTSTTAGEVQADDLQVDGQVRVDATAGDVRFALTSPPEGIEVDTTAAEVHFEIPAGDYRIDASTTAGQVDQHLASNTQADRVYTFTSTAGDITLVEGS